MPGPPTPSTAPDPAAPVEPVRPVSFRRLGRVGRLGNALFELAATTGIAHRLGLRPRFNADWIHRPWFSVPDECFTEAFDGCVEAPDTRDVAHIDERTRVYLQDLSLFDPILPTLSTWLAPSAAALEILDGPSGAAFRALPRPVLAVHVRRGDNLFDPWVEDKHDYFPVPPAAYYRRAIEALAPAAASVAVFGDDPDWNRRHLDADYFHVGVPRPKEFDADFLTAPVLDWVDLQLMARCEAGAVLSNSTFGLWGALLAGHDNVTYPWPWYGPKLAHVDATLMLRPSWRRVDAGVAP